MTTIKMWKFFSYTFTAMFVTWLSLNLSAGISTSLDFFRIVVDCLGTWFWTKESIRMVRVDGFFF